MNEWWGGPASGGIEMAMSASGDSFPIEAPPQHLLGKPCAQGAPFSRELHKWSWTKARAGARVECKRGEWHHKWLAHELCNHGMVMSVEPQQNKLKNSSAADHESDTNYRCTFAGAGMQHGWAALMGYSRFRDKGGHTHGWVQFGKGCTHEREKDATMAVFLECFGFDPDSVESATLPPHTHWRPKAQPPASGGMQQEQAQQPASSGVQQEQSAPAPTTGGGQPPQPVHAVAEQSTPPTLPPQPASGGVQQQQSAPAPAAGGGQSQPVHWQPQSHPAATEQPKLQVPPPTLPPHPQHLESPAQGRQVPPGLLQPAAGGSGQQPLQPQTQLPAAVGGQPMSWPAPPPHPQEWLSAPAAAAVAQPQKPPQPGPAAGGQPTAQPAAGGVPQGPAPPADPQRQPPQGPAPPVYSAPQAQQQPATGGAPQAPQQPQPAPGGQQVRFAPGPAAPAESSAAAYQPTVSPQQPQPAAGGDTEEESEKEEARNDPAAEESEWTAEQEAAWEAAVAAVARREPPQKKRTGGFGFWARFTSYARPTPLPRGQEWLMEAVSRWSGSRSQWILDNGPDAMSKEQLNFLFGMMGSWQPKNLIREVPERESRTLSACVTEAERWGLIRDLSNKHRGEAREIQGGWRYVSKPFPVEEKYFHAQYCHLPIEAKQRTTGASWKGKPASGGKGGKAALPGKAGSTSSSHGKGGQKGPVSDGEENTFLARDSENPAAGHWLREATVIGLPELFAKFGGIATATELYDWWGGARVLVHKRLHGTSDPARQEAAIRRFKETGKWGHGRRR